MYFMEISMFYVKHKIYGYKKGNYMHTKRGNADSKYTQIPQINTLYQYVYDVLYPFAKY